MIFQLFNTNYVLSRPFIGLCNIYTNLCRATSGGYIKFGCSREVLFLRGYFQWSMSLREGDVFAGRERKALVRGAALGGKTVSAQYVLARTISLYTFQD